MEKINNFFRMAKSTWGVIAIFVGAIILANNAIIWFGERFSVINAFCLIGLSITTRDVIHERWQSKGLWVKMGGLIVLSGCISWITNPATGQIAVASVIAFGCSMFVDTLIYQLLIKNKKIIKINGSNVFSSFADSIIFPIIAFGGFPLLIIIGQFIAKITGGFIWSLVIQKNTEGKP